MSPSEMGALAGLALADSTSIGTLVIPVWLLMRERFEARRTLLYLVAVAGFYWVVSLVLLAFMARVAAATESIHLGRSWVWGQLAIGGMVLAIGFWCDQRPAVAMEGSPRVQRWRDRMLRLDENRTVVGLALTAGVMELATMLPLLTALGMLEKSNLSPTASVLAMTGYVALMMLPATALLAMRVALGVRVAKPIASLGRRLERHAHAITATVLMAVGGLASADAAIRLDLIS